MGNETGDREKCPSCAEWIAAEARVCPMCRNDVLVDVVVDRPVGDARLRYQVAREITALGEPYAGLIETQRRLAGPAPSVATRVTMAEARRSLAILERAGLTARTRASGRGEATRGSGGLTARNVAVSVAVAVLLTAGLGSLLWSRRHASAPAQEATPPPPAATRSIQQQQLTTQEIAARILPSTVTVHCGNAVGAGFFVTEDLVLTNAHVVDQGRDDVTIHLADGRGADGQVAQRLPSVDLALLRISSIRGTPLALGDAGRIEVGERVLLVGSPRQLEFTVHEGLISSVSRSSFGTAYLQLDAKINPGNSGGPVVNMNGEVVGVVTLKLADAEGIGFALPINYVYTDTTLVPAPPNVDATRFGAMLARAAEDEKEMTTSLTDAWGQPALVKVERHRTDTQYGSQFDYLLYVARLSQGPPATLAYEIKVSFANTPLCVLTGDVREWERVEGAHASSFTDPRTAAWLQRKNLDAQVYVGTIIVPRPPCTGLPEGRTVSVELVGADPGYSRANLRW